MVCPALKEVRQKEAERKWEGRGTRRSLSPVQEQTVPPSSAGSPPTQSLGNTGAAHERVRAGREPLV